jgi:hypothetical protein
MIEPKKFYFFQKSPAVAGQGFFCLRLIRYSQLHHLPEESAV